MKRGGGGEGDEKTLIQMRERQEGRFLHREERREGARGGFGAVRARLAPATGDDVMKLMAWRDFGSPLKKLSSQESDVHSKQGS